MDYTFVPQYNGEQTKRRRLAKACASCRARKKRCHHHPIEEADSEQSGEKDGSNESSPAKNRQEHYSLQTQEHKAYRFLSDLTPHTRLLDRTAASKDESERANSMTTVGVWVSKDEYESLVKQHCAAVEAGLAQPSNASSTIPLTPAHEAGLVNVFFSKIHPLIPILCEEEFRKSYADGKLSKPWIYAVCLLAAKDSEADQYLREANISARSLCSRLYRYMKAAVSNTSRYDKLSLIRLLALISMHNEGSDGAEEASLYLMQAMHHCQTLGLHLSASFPTEDGKHTKRLFWALWALDRLTAAMNGRPILMADNDVAIEQFEVGENGYPAFDVLYKIVSLLNEVIDLYRPGNSPTSTGWEKSFPGFEEIVESVKAWNLPQTMLSTLHIAYLTVAILSHRSRGAADFASSTPSYIRQSLAASKIVRYISPARLPTLHSVPILPYAVSLALSVSYQHLRQDQLLYQQEDARADFEACFTALRDLKRSWSSVDAIFTLSEKVTEELKRLPNISAFRQRRNPGDEKKLESVTSACKHDGDAVEHPTNNNATLPTPNDDVVMDGAQQVLPQVYDAQPARNDDVLFEGIDDIFGTFMDPNYPINLDFLDQYGSFDAGDWTGVAT